METPTVTLAPRTVTGKKVRFLRREGMVPVHFYGRGVDSLALQVETATLRRVITSAGANVPVKVTIDGRDGEEICFIRDAQRHPVSEDLLHVDFYRVDVDRLVRAEVPVIMDGEAPAVRNLGGVLLQPFNSLEVEALPLDMPASFHVDVSGLEDFEAAVRIGDIQVAGEVNILRDDQEVIARVAPPRIEEEEEEVVDELEEGVEGEEVEGEEGAAEESSEAEEWARA